MFCRNVQRDLTARLKPSYPNRTGCSDTRCARLLKPANKLRPRGLQAKEWNTLHQTVFSWRLVTEDENSELFFCVEQQKTLSVWWVGVHLPQTTSYILMTVDAETINPAANHTSDIFKVYFSLFFLHHFEFYLSKSSEGNVLVRLSSPLFSHLSLELFNEIIEEQASFLL